MASVARPLTLVDLALPRSSALTNTLLVVAASLLTAAAAQLAIRLPWTPVPITGQTFAVLLSGTVLGARRAFIAQCLYLVEGALEPGRARSTSVSGRATDAMRKPLRVRDCCGRTGA